MQFKPLSKHEGVDAEQRSMDERLHELEHLKEEFELNIYHELRTPLTSIRAFAEILLSEPDLEPALRQKFLQIMVDETERLTEALG